MRDLRNRTSQVIDTVRAGEPIVLIVHGVAVADIVDSTTTAEVMRPRDQVLSGRGFSSDQAEGVKKYCWPTATNGGP